MLTCKPIGQLGGPGRNRPQVIFVRRSTGRGMKSAYFGIASLFLAAATPVSAEPFSINDALKQAALTNPGVGEASANRRATESELRQTQSTLLPQVRLEARYGPEKFDQSAAVVSSSATPIPAPGAGGWRNGSQGSVVVRQVLFDGFASINDIWRQSARVNAAAFRVKERTELAGCGGSLRRRGPLYAAHRTWTAECRHP